MESGAELQPRLNRVCPTEFARTQQGNNTQLATIEEDGCGASAGEQPRAPRIRDPTPPLETVEVDDRICLPLSKLQTTQPPPTPEHLPTGLSGTSE
jgi:hypothetical protein